MLGNEGQEAQAAAVAAAQLLPPQQQLQQQQQQQVEPKQPQQAPHEQPSAASPTQQHSSTRQPVQLIPHSQQPRPQQPLPLRPPAVLQAAAQSGQASPFLPYIPFIPPGAQPAGHIKQGVFYPLAPPHTYGGKDPPTALATVTGRLHAVSPGNKQQLPLSSNTSPKTPAAPAASPARAIPTSAAAAPSSLHSNPMAVQSPTTPPSQRSNGAATQPTTISPSAANTGSATANGNNKRGNPATQKDARVAKMKRIEDEKERKRLKRLLRNRVSAQQARERKKAYMGTLEGKSKDLEAQNAALLARVAQLQNENNMLRNIVKNTTAKPAVDEAGAQAQSDISQAAQQQGQTA
eukprot:jgi/Chlat1/7215/Chrsp57S06866